MATRYSGNLTIDVRWVEAKAVSPSERLKKARGCPHNGYYRVAFSGPHAVGVQFVCAPAHLTHAIDSAEAYDSAAHAGLSLAADDALDEAAMNPAMGSGGPLWHIGRTQATAWPKDGRDFGSFGKARRGESLESSIARHNERMAAIRANKASSLESFLAQHNERMAAIRASKTSKGKKGRLGCLPCAAAMGMSSGRTGHAHMSLDRWKGHSIDLRVGDLWESPSTKNRWTILSIEDTNDGVWVVVKNKRGETHRWIPEAFDRLSLVRPAAMGASSGRHPRLDGRTRSRGWWLTAKWAVESQGPKGWETIYHATSKAKAEHDAKAWTDKTGFPTRVVPGPAQTGKTGRAAGSEGSDTPKNRETSEREIAAWLSSPPNEAMVYYSDDMRSVMNWMGVKMGDIVRRGPEVKRWNGGKTRSVQVHGTNGVDYHGICNMTGGTYCRLRRIASSRQNVLDARRKRFRDATRAEVKAAAR